MGLWFPKEYLSYTISDTSKYIREIGKIYIYIYINSPRWASHPTLLGLRKEQLQHLIAASCINLLQQKPWSLVMKVHSSSPTTLLGQNRNRWSYGHGQWAIASPFCHAPNPKGSKAWEKTSQSTCRFFLFDNPIHKIISSTNIKNYYNNSIEYTLKVGRSFKK